MNDNNNGSGLAPATRKIILLRRNKKKYVVDVVGNPYDTRAGHDNHRSIIEVTVSENQAIGMLTAAQLDGRDVALYREEDDIWALAISPPMPWELESNLLAEVDDTHSSFLAGTGRL